MRYLLIVLLFSGCALYQPRTSEDAIKLVTEAGGTGCMYLRGNSRPYADVSFLTIATYGQGTSYESCLAAIPSEARSMLMPPQ